MKKLFKKVSIGLVSLVIGCNASMFVLAATKPKITSQPPTFVTINSNTSQTSQLNQLKQQASNIVASPYGNYPVVQEACRQICQTQNLSTAKKDTQELKQIVTQISKDNAQAGQLLAKASK